MYLKILYYKISKSLLSARKSRTYPPQTLDTPSLRGQRYAMAGKPQHTSPRVKVSLNLDAEDLRAIEDLAHRLKRDENLPRKWGKGNLMESWIKEGLARAIREQNARQTPEKELAPTAQTEQR